MQYVRNAQVLSEEILLLEDVLGFANGKPLHDEFDLN